MTSSIYWKSMSGGQHKEVTSLNPLASSDTNAPLAAEGAAAGAAEDAGFRDAPLADEGANTGSFALAGAGVIISSRLGGPDWGA